MNKRNDGLNKFVQETSEQNDKLILDALEYLEKPKNWSKYKATAVDLKNVILDIYGETISRGTIDNREWAKNKIKSIKQIRNNKTILESDQVIETKSEEERLIERCDSLFSQNGLLFEENINLHKRIERQEKEMLMLKRKIERFENDKVIQLR